MSENALFKRAQNHGGSGPDYPLWGPKSSASVISAWSALRERLETSF
jgi:hypothetical protein